MLRMPFRPVTIAAVAGIVPAVAGIVWLLGAVIAEGRELTTVEDITLDFLIGTIILVTLGWLFLWHQSQDQEKYKQEIDTARRTLATAISHMSQGLVMFDATQRIVLCNQRYVDIYGLSPAVVQPGLSFRELLIHRKARGSFFGDVDEYCAAMAAKLAKGKTSSLVAQNRDGRLVRIVNEALENGGWVATHEDVTEQHNAEKQIREQKLQLDTALNSMSQGLNMFDASGRLIVCNEQYLQMYRVSPEVVKPGCTVEELVDARIASETFFSDDVPQYVADLMNAMRHRVGAKTTRHLPDGRTIAVSSQPTPDGDGWVVTHEDITERQELLEAQELSEKIVSQQKVQLDVALNNMTHGLCMFDAEGRIVLFNRRYSEMMDQSAEYLRGLSLLDLFKHRKATGAFRGDPEELFSSVMTRMREGKTTIREMMRVDGICLRVVDHPMEDGGWVATYEDVTEQRRTERDRDQNRAFLDLIIDNVPSAIFVKNAIDRKYVLVNRVASASGEFRARP